LTDAAAAPDAVSAMTPSRPKPPKAVRPPAPRLVPSSGTGAAPPSLAEQAYLAIRNQILRGDLPVEASLSRRKLAAGLGISVPPVSEALQRLEREGLVESKPRAGTRVRVPTRPEVEDRYLLREALETQAARLFAERATPAEKKELQRLGRQTDRLYAACEAGVTNPDRLFSVNTFHMNLHLRIADCARCPVLRNAIEKEQVLVFNWLYDTAVQRRSLGSDYHARLTRVLATGRPDEAADAMRQHLRHGLSQVLNGWARLDEARTGWRRQNAGFDP